MILLREVQEKDLETLERLAQIPGFINLPDDRDLLHEKIMKSVDSFLGRLNNLADTKFLFVAEDLESKRVLGTSMIAGQHGTIESPHFYFEIGSEEKYSETISTGFIHGTLKLKYDTDGPSEIGGLVLNPEFRHSESKLGRQISFVRFLYAGLNRSKFKRKILAELLPPLNKKGQSPLWEAIGRRFTNMDYWEADELCRKNKEFIFSLFPTGKIYTTFLPAEARDAIGRVGKETEPVLHMLKKIGFKYKEQVDPFDGGPHLWADFDEIVPIKKMVQRNYSRELRFTGNAKPNPEAGLFCKANQNPEEFKAIAVQAIQTDQQISLIQPDLNQVEMVLCIAPGDPVHFMPYY